MVCLVLQYFNEILLNINFDIILNVMIEMGLKSLARNEVSLYRLNSGLSNTKKKHTARNGTHGRVFAKIKAYKLFPNIIQIIRSFYDTRHSCNL